MEGASGSSSTPGPSNLSDYYAFSPKRDKPKIGKVPFGLEREPTTSILNQVRFDEAPPQEITDILSRHYKPVPTGVEPHLQLAMQRENLAGLASDPEMLKILKKYKATFTELADRVARIKAPAVGVKAKKTRLKLGEPKVLEIVTALLGCWHLADMFFKSCRDYQFACDHSPKLKLALTTHFKSPMQAAQALSSEINYGSSIGRVLSGFSEQFSQYVEMVSEILAWIKANPNAKV